jgi:hypothetical protein
VTLLGAFFEKALLIYAQKGVKRRSNDAFAAGSIFAK